MHLIFIKREVKKYISYMITSGVDWLTAVTVRSYQLSGLCRLSPGDAVAVASTYTNCIVYGNGLVARHPHHLFYGSCLAP